MSFRLIANRLAKHGRYFVQWYCKREIYTNILEQGRNKGIPSLPKAGGQLAQLPARNTSGVFRFGQHARKLFVDNILNRVTTNYSLDLRAQASKKLFYGDSAPFFALIGVSLASGAGVLTKEDELEGVCWEIREAATRIQNLWNSEEISKSMDENFDLDNLDIGPPIEKGCAAVVYAASFKDQEEAPVIHQPTRPTLNEYRRVSEQQFDFASDMMSPIQNTSRFVHNFGGSADNLHLYNQRASFDTFFGNGRILSPDEARGSRETTTGSEKRKFSTISWSEAEMDNIFGTVQVESDIENLQKGDANISRYPLALKMMFNYDIQSNALTILRAMYKETIPARSRISNEITNEWEKALQDQTLTLPPHPNIVVMFGYFCAEVRNFKDGHLLYPIAQPPRINPQGYGRNMSLYLLMKRYDCCLRQFLDEDVNIRTRVLLFAQLLEAIAHLNRHGIAHRDLKSDNILIEFNDDNSPPLLVLSDFGCCLADKVNGLQIPYNSHDVDKGGNAALMAPEIINKTPGTFSVLNYSKADLWACGAIAYEIFGQNNPFYSLADKNITEGTKSLRNVNYNHDDLPDLGPLCPDIVQKLIFNILNPNPNKRLSPDIASNVMQLYLWAPSAWLKAGGMPSSPEVLQWLLSLSTKVMCENRNTNDLYFKKGRRTYVEYILICSFLARARLRRIRGALSWIQNVI